MGMGFGEKLRITLFGESHGECVGALVEGIPPGTLLDKDALADDIAKRRPGRKGLSTRKELDDCEILSGIHKGVATGWPILLLTRNTDVKSSDYSFLPEQPRPGHADMVENIRSEGANDPRGGGSQSARLTFGIVAAGSQVRQILKNKGWICSAHLHKVGDISARPLFELEKGTSLSQSSDMGRLNCRDLEAATLMSRYLEEVRMDRDTVGSVVELLIEGLPIGLGEPWFDGLEPALARGLMAIPGARAIEFSQGVLASIMRGSEHNDTWLAGDGVPILEGADKGDADGALGGRSTGAPMSIKIHFKPPSSIPREQFTLHLPSNEVRSLKVGGRHDPVLGPRAAPVVEAVAMLVIADLGMIGGYL
jgi:chorismate synthase